MAAMRKLGVDMTNWSLQLNRNYTGMATGNPASNNSFAMAFPDFFRIFASDKYPEVYAHLRKIYPIRPADLQVTAEQSYSCEVLLKDRER